MLLLAGRAIAHPIGAEITPVCVASAAIFQALAQGPPVVGVFCKGPMFRTVMTMFNALEVISAKISKNQP